MVLCKNLGIATANRLKLKVGDPYLMSLNNVSVIRSDLCMELVDLAITCLYNSELWFPS